MTDHARGPREALLDNIRSVVREVDTSGRAASVSNNESLLAAGVIDSMAMIELITALESRFGVQVQDADLTPENFDSITAIGGLIQRKLDVVPRPAE